jgi:hypothetical protein
MPNPNQATGLDLLLGVDRQSIMGQRISTTAINAIHAQTLMYSIPPSAVTIRLGT